MMNFYSKEVKDELLKLPSNAQKIRYLIKLLQDNPQKYSTCVQPATKCADKSLQACGRGSEYLDEDNYMAALVAYNEALCYAHIESESVGLLYAHRSEIYLDTGFFGFCLENIQLALEKCPEDYKPKLLKRQETCLEKMKTEKDSFEIYGNVGKPLLSHPANPKIPFMIDALKCVETAEFGRHIVTHRDLKPGDTVLVEEPFVKTIDCDMFKSFRYCYNCAQHNFFNLKPCPKSPKVMFCSKKCADEAWNRFYKFEVHILDTLLYLKSPLTPLRATLKAFTMEKDRELKELIESIDVGTENGFNLDWTKANESEKFRALYSLATHEEKFNSDQLFSEKLYDLMVGMANIFVQLMKQDEFKSLIKSEEDEDLFLSLWMRLFLIFKVNGHTIVDQLAVDDTQRVVDVKYGQGVHLLISLFSHSCCPNVRRICARESSAMVVVRPIKAGEQLFDSYGVHFSTDTLQERKDFLYKFYFDCKCVACVEDFKTIETSQMDHALIPDQIRKDIHTLYSCSFDEEMMTAVEDLIKLLPDTMIEFQKYYPDGVIELFEANLSLCYRVLFNKMPLKMIFNSL